MKRIFLIITFALLCFPSFAEITNGSQTFAIEITKIGESDFGFCTFDSATSQTVEKLNKGIVFENWNSSEQVTTDTVAPETSFGLFWDLYFETASSISLDLTFSASNTGAYEYMLESKDGAVLNFSVEGTTYEDRDNSKSTELKGIQVPSNQVNQDNFLDRSINILKADVSDYDNLYGSARIKLTLNFPTNENGEITNFFGGEYNGYAIFSVSVT